MPVIYDIHTRVGVVGTVRKGGATTYPDILRLFGAEFSDSSTNKRHVLPCLVGGWATPLKNVSSSVGMMTFPTEWEKKKGLTPPTSIGSCFCVEFVLHCRGFCLHLWMYFAKESDFQVELENRQEGIPRNMRYILTKLEKNIEHTRNKNPSLDSQRLCFLYPSLTCFFPAFFSPEEIPFDKRLHRRPGFRFHLWHRPQRMGWDYPLVI